MNTSDIDYRDLFLEATAELQEIIRETLEELKMPVTEQQLRQLWMQLPDDVKEEMVNDPNDN